jgi:hypothetical protein
MAGAVFARYTVRAGEEARVANALRNMLKGQVLPYLEDRVRLDLVPLED